MHQERPDVATTLDAVVRFLTSELYGTIPDKGLSFRVLIAANMLMQCASEVRAEPGRSQRDNARLRALLGLGADAPESDLKARLMEALVQHDTLHADALGAIADSLRDTLACNNPAFSLDEEIE